jgi:hypothetical protein
MLTKKQRNDIFGAIVAGGVQPTDFSERNAEKYIVVCNGTPYSMTISLFNQYFRGRTFPIVEGNSDSSLHFWPELVTLCKKWAELVKEEREIPDLWLEAQSNSKLFAFNPAVPNEMFTGAELRQLEGKVRQLVQGLSTLGLPAHAQKLLTDTVKEIPEKATRFTKKELEGWFMGAFIAQVTNLMLSQEHVNAVAHLVKTTFFGLLGLSQ